MPSAHIARALGLFAVLGLPVASAIPLLIVVPPNALATFPGGYSVAVDSQGNVLIGSPGKLSKYSPDGAQRIWERTFPDGSSSPEIDVDAQDNVYGSAGLMRMYAPNGDLRWETFVSSGVFRVLAAPDGGVLVGHRESTDRLRSYVAKLDAEGRLLWRVQVGRDGDAAWEMGVKSDDSLIAVVGYQATWALDGSGRPLWVGGGGASGVAVDAAGNVYIGARTGSNILGDTGWLTKLRPDGSVVWTRSEPVGYLAMWGDTLVASRPLSYGIYIDPIPRLRGYEIHGYNTESGLWEWGFRHITGTYTGTFFTFGGNLYARPGHLAVTSSALDTAVYQDWLLHACTATPVTSLPLPARHCVFTPV